MLKTEYAGIYTYETRNNKMGLRLKKIKLRYVQHTLNGGHFTYMYYITLHLLIGGLPKYM